MWLQFRLPVSMLILEQRGGGSVIRDALDLDGLRLIALHDRTEDQARTAEVEPTYDPTACPSCKGGRLYRHGVRDQHYVDAPHYGEPAVLLVRRRRWRCQDCSTLFPDPLPAIDEKRRATQRLVRYVRGRSLKYTFAEIGREVGLSDRSIRHIFDDLVRDLETQFEFVTPRYLGIDEVKLIGKYRCILTNVEANTVYDMLATREMAGLREYFRRFRNPKAVEVVTADLWNNYAVIAREFFPKALFVADRFHVQRMATNAVEAVRKAVRRSLTQKRRIQLKDDRFVLLRHGHSLSAEQMTKLKSWGDQFPLLGAAWEAKERFFACWNTKSRAIAARELDAWAASITGDVRPYFAELLTAWSRRRDDILNYFDCPVTNAYTESINRLAKSINRMGRGYTLEVVRAKMLYDSNALEKGTMTRRVAVQVPDDDLGGLGMGKIGYAAPAKSTGRRRVGYVTELVCMGAHIPTLCDKLESGAFE